MKLVYTVKEASNLLDFKLSKTYDLLYQNKIPCIKLGKRILIPKNLLDNIIKNRLEMNF